MYRTCAFCNARFDGDGGPSGLGVGRRLAFDEWKGRLWVVCPRCARWNLAPLDDRLDRIEALARVARTGQIAAATDEVQLIRWQRYELVRVGRPPRVELATWRYGERLKRQSRERAMVVVPLTLAAAGLAVAVNVAAGGSLGIFVWNMGSIAEAAYVALVGNRRISLAEPPVCARCGSAMRLRARHIPRSMLVRDARADLALVVRCPACGEEGALLSGSDAAAALRRGLTFLNARRTGRRSAAHAAHLVEDAGGPDSLIRDVARRELSLRSFDRAWRLALEMAVDEHAEVRELERQWREAEELAEIADGTLSPSAEVEEQLRRIREKVAGEDKNQSDG